jgi:1,2-diacylglycerol 3-alpha-glucosyltransferase
MFEIDASGGSDVKTASHTRNGAERYSIAMVAACAFPANHGSPASVREMSDTLSQMGHAVHIVTYSTGQKDIVVRHAKVHRTAPFHPETNAKVGPSWEKFLEDLALLRLLLRVVRRERIDIIHAHNYEAALIGVLAKWITGRPLLYNAVNLMSDELGRLRFHSPRLARPRNRARTGLVCSNFSGSHHGRLSRVEAMVDRPGNCRAKG